MHNIKEYLKEDWNAVQGHITSALESDIELLNATNRSILSNSGKQLRPLLSILFARICAEGEASEASLRYAAAAELLHNATLLHDDVADGSDQRRGVPTIRSLMGPSVSVLVGDYWLVKAMELILKDKESDVRAIKIFSKTLSDLAEGEMLQLQMAQTCNTTEADYERIIYNKTATLFEAACLSAAVSVAASEERRLAASKYAVSLGMAFQVKDDILDYSGTESSVGKALGVDVLEQKITLPLLGALSNVSQERKEEIREKIRNITSDPAGRDEIVAFVVENAGLEYAEGRLSEYVEAAVKALDVFPDSKEKEFLVNLAYFTAKRAK